MNPRVTLNLTGAFLFGFAAGCVRGNETDQPASYAFYLFAAFKAGGVIGHDFTVGAELLQIGARQIQRETGGFGDLGIKRLAMFFQVLEDAVHVNPFKS